MNYEQESEEEKYADPEWNKILKNLSMDEEEQEEKETVGTERGRKNKRKAGQLSGIDDTSIESYSEGELEDPNEIENPEEIARAKENKRSIIRTAQKWC